MFKKSLLALALGTTATLSAMSAHAVNVNNGDTLTITAGITQTDANGNPTNVTNSWFGMDVNNNSAISGTEKTALAQGTTGLVIGVTTSAGASHGGCPTGSDSNAITAPWCFFGNTGSDFLTTAVTGGTTGLNMSGWTVTWNGIAAIPMGSGAWGTGFTSGVGNFVWDGVYGHSYTLDYHATVPQGDPSGFGGVKYALHLVGVVTAPVPEASTYGMMLAGLGLVGFAARRRKQR